MINRDTPTNGSSKKFSRTKRLGSIDKFISLKEIGDPPISRKVSEFHKKQDLKNTSLQILDKKEASFEQIFQGLQPDSPSMQAQQSPSRNPFSLFKATHKRQVQNGLRNTYTPRQDKTQRFQLTQSVKLPAVKASGIEDHKITGEGEVPARSLKDKYGYDGLNMVDSWMLKDFEIDPRDYKLLVPFSEQLDINEKQFSKNDQSTIRMWLASVYESVSSDAFLKYLKDQLTTPEVKNYASKNYILNIHKFMQKINRGDENKIYREKVFDFINKESSKIVRSLKMRYPQAILAGGSSRKFKKTISRPDNSQSLNYDLFYAKKGENINFEHNEGGDYMPAIMRTLNYLIGIGSQGFKQQKDMLTKYQAFELMMTHIFKHSKCANEEFFSQMSLRDTSSFYTQYNCMKSQSLNFWERAQSFQKKFDECLIEDSTGQKKHYDEQVSFSIGKKVSDEVEMFTQQQIETGDITIRDGALLRIVTKWAEELRQKLADPEEHILNRVQLFKTKSGEIVELSKEMKKALCDAAKEEEKRIKQIFGTMKQHYIKLEQEIFSLDYDGTYLNTLDTNIGIVSGRTEACIGQYMVIYLNHLIHCLCRVSLEAGKKFSKFPEKKALIESIDLITFKLGDIMRAKAKTKESQIISIYKFIQNLSEKFPQVLKIVKLKDRLDNKDKDVLITFMFLNQIKCEVQLSIAMQVDIRQKKYNQFNHYLYELERAEFGPIAEAACIIAKYDPIVDKTYKAIVDDSELTRKCRARLRDTAAASAMQMSLVQMQSQAVATTADTDLPFFCEGCKKLIQNRNPNFFKNRIHKQQYQECNDCAGMRILEMNQKALTMRSISLCNFVRKNQEKSDSSEFELIKQLFRGLYEVNSPEMKIIVKHFNVDHKETLSDKQQKGIIIAKNTKTPTPLFYKTIFYQNRVHFLTATDDGQNGNGATAIISINLKMTPKRIAKKLSDYYFLTTTTAAFEENKAKQQITVNCNCCEGSPFVISKFFGYENIIYDENMKFLTNVKKTQKETLYLNERTLTQELYNIGVMKNIKRFYAQNASLKDMNFLFDKVEITGVGSCPHYDFIEKFENIEYLNVSSNKIREIIGLKNLRILKCSDNGIKSLQAISKSEVLTELDISYNNLEDLRGLDQFPALTNLNCSYNLIEKINSSSYHVKILDISFNKLVSLNGINNFSALKIVKACQNNLEQLGFNHRSPHILELDISANKLTNITSIDHIQSLERLICNSNQIEDVSKIAIKEPKMPNLQYVQICANKLTTLEGIQNFKQLRVLHCKANKIGTLEIQVVCIPIEELYIENNELMNLNGVEAYLNLEVLHCGYNKIQSLKFQKVKKLAIVSSRYPPRLRTLDIEFNKLGSLEGIEEVENLKKLYCQGNKIQELGVKQEIPKLQQLYMRRNGLERLSGIQNFTFLKKLQCCENKFESYRPLLRLEKLYQIDVGEVKHLKLEQLNQLKHIKKIKGYCKIAQPEQEVRTKYPILAKFEDFQIEQLVKLPVPDFQRLKCPSCTKRIKDYPVFYCYWEKEQNQFRCRECIELRNEWDTFQYGKNAILMMDKFGNNVLKNRLGKNLQPQNPGKGIFHDFECKYCKVKQQEDSKQARYMCLGCKPEVEATDFVDMCQVCMNKYLDPSKNGQMKQSLERLKHCANHPWLRILFKVKSYHEY